MFSKIDTISVVHMKTHVGAVNGTVNPKSRYIVEYSQSSAAKIVKMYADLCHNPSRIFDESTVLFTHACENPEIMSRIMNPATIAKTW